MQVIKKLYLSVTISFLLLAVICAASFVLLMFTKGTSLGHHVGLFGSLFFDARATSSGSIMVGLGIENPGILALIYALLWLFSWVFLSFYSMLKRRKDAE